MRCPDCNKFVPYDTEVDPEENNEPEFDGVEFRGEYRRVLNCEECGLELKAADLEVAASELEEESLKDGCEHEWEVEAEATPGTKVIDTDRYGRKIKYRRYMRTEYGVEVSFSATCSKCNGQVTATGEAWVAASGMDEQI